MTSSDTQPDCLFCRIVAGEIPATVVAETDTTVAFRDINPHAPTHVLVVPREHHQDAVELAEQSPGVLADLFTAAGRIAAAEGIAADGYRLLFNTGADAGQTVPHAHLHLLGGRPLGGLVGGPLPE
ncbi:histidine triad nucleotide-binding protein [Goodfellowiella coeruleoviolacea]|uniref:Histidine triad (HIT) family protein n=1 Tax=Goodfellowiella coeruleoviolacea TaxID=334858 RepID=A0AAE3GDC9_9PSEU|nr:histidine triad nucleotide-binding protein [Goodfellowiella coeruleoviolacea]MCP2165177.1 histidine triad (HIT) family protein [Goodfellowiella coeruleoviolacea]